MLPVITSVKMESSRIARAGDAEDEKILVGNTCPNTEAPELVNACMLCGKATYAVLLTAYSRMSDSHGTAVQRIVTTVWLLLQQVISTK